MLFILWFIGEFISQMEEFVLQLDYIRNCKASLV